MSLTDFQKQLLSAHQFERQWRVKVGPRRGFAIENLFNLGEPVTLPDTTHLLSRDFDSSQDTTLNLVSVHGIPSAGTLILSPYSDAFGLVSYSGVDVPSRTLTNIKLIQGSARHLQGSTCVTWLDISDKVTKAPTITRVQETNARDWSASLSGVGYDARFMTPDCSLLIEQRFVLFDRTITSWTLAAFGYVPMWDVTTGHNEPFSWKCKVKSIRHYMKSKKVKAQRFGVVKLETSVTASGTLASPFLEPEEFVLGVGELSPSSVVDGNHDTAWISDRGV